MPEEFELQQQLGRGGMGVVWKARDTVTGETVALKLLHDLYAGDAEYVARFEREVELCRRIDSPAVVKMLGFGRREGVPFLAMEYVDGPSLKERLNQHGPYTWDEAKPLLVQVARGLEAAHAAGIVHRDVKPSNILLANDGAAKLADFGIARANDVTRLTGTNATMGTAAYMAPEGQRDERSDLYSLGSVAYEMLTGRPPFEGSTPQEIWTNQITGSPNIGIIAEEPARKVVGWLLARNVDDRPQSAAALVAVLEGSSRVPRGPGLRLRKPLLAGVAAAGIAVIAGAGLAVGLAMRGSGARPPAAANSPTPDRVVVVTTTTSPAASRTGAAVAPATPTATVTSALAATSTSTPTPRATATPVAMRPTATPYVYVPPTVTPTRHVSVPPTATPTRHAPTPTPTRRVLPPTATRTATPTPTRRATSTPTRMPPPATATPDRFWTFSAYLPPGDYHVGGVLPICYVLPNGGSFYTLVITETGANSDGPTSHNGLRGNACLTVNIGANPGTVTFSVQAVLSGQEVGAATVQASIAP